MPPNTAVCVLRDRRRLTRVHEVPPNERTVWLHLAITLLAGEQLLRASSRAAPTGTTPFHTQYREFATLPVFSRACIEACAVPCSTDAEARRPLLSSQASARSERTYHSDPETPTWA